MKKISILFILILSFSFAQCKKEKQNSESTTTVISATKNETKEALISRVIGLAEHQYELLIKEVDTINPLLQPRSIKKDGSLKMAHKEDWTSGFFPGSLWYLFEQTKKEKWKSEAIRFTESLDSAQFVTSNHDVGFMIQNSFGNGFRLTGNETYKQAVVDAAKSLSTRYRPVAKVIQSWDTDAFWIEGRGLDMPIIIDNMMNLNLLYQASKHTSDTSFSRIANAHATSTIKNQYRENFSCFHIVDYDHITGEVRKKVNFQGFADDSSWARGQAWGLYGYVETYKNTGKKEFLEQAKHIAHYIMNTKQIPGDNIPFWDYDAKSTQEIPRDASAAAIVASALLDLQDFDAKNRTEYLRYAEKTIRTLSSKEYLASKGGNKGFILKHSVGNFHEDNENDTAINYADYYFLEALVKWNKL
jgi:rhamnogalacturonyl hydrolase YesR